MSIKSFIDIKGKVAIVTGASAGIGEAIALEYARQGCHLTLCGRNEGRLNKVKDRCLKEGNGDIEIEQVCGNIADADVQRRIVAATFRAFGKIDILINNAGAVLVRTPQTATQEEYRDLMQTNLESVFFLTQLAIPYLIKSKGSVVNISSVVSIQGLPKYSVYAMSKAALDSYTRSLALHLAPYKVRVNSVNPGSVESLIYRRGQEAMDDEQYLKFKSTVSASNFHPLGRMPLASECADTVVYLTSSRASFITGQIVFVDGGRNIVTAQPQPAKL